MAVCPNCGANVGFAKVCPHCGSTLGTNVSEQTSTIEQIKETTSNFSQKPTCSDSEFQEMVVKFLANGSAGEKNIYEARVKAYCANYRNGGTGIVNNPIKSEYVRSGEEATTLVSSDSPVAAAAVASSKAKSKPFSSKKLAVITCAILGAVLVIGCAVGIPVGVHAAKEKKTSDVTLYANYPEGGSSTYYVVEHLRIMNGEAKSLANYQLPPGRTGYTFEGYYNDPYYGDRYFDQYGRATKDWDYSRGDISLYAHWDLITVNIRLDNSINGSSTNIVAIPNQSMPTLNEVPSYSGYVFTGYYDLNGVKYYDNYGESAHICDLENNAILVTRWERAVYLDDNGGNGGLTYVTVTSDYALPTLYVLPTRNGYNFTGYYSNSTSGTKYYDSYGYYVGGLYDPTCPSYLYAHWEAATCTITLNKNGGSGGTSSVTATYGNSMPSISVPTKSGYSFLGYYTSSSGGTQYYNSSGSSTRTCDFISNTTLYAHWQTYVVTIGLDNNGGTGGTTSVNATYGSAMPSITVPTRTGHTFLGYYTSTSGGTKYYNSDGSSARSSDFTTSTTLYAQWNPVTVTITLNKNGGSGGTSSVSATYGGVFPQINVPSRSGYYFTGYYTNVSGGLLYYTYDGVGVRTSAFTSSTTLYARWSTTSNLSYHWANSGEYGFEQISGAIFRSTNFHVHGSTATMVITFFGTGTVEYQYKVSSEQSCDYLTIRKNSYQLHRVSGNGSWQSSSIGVLNGDTMTIIYSKDSSVHSNDDTAYFRITNI